MAVAGLVVAATLDPARADLRVEAGWSGAVVEARGVQGARATPVGGRGGDRRRKGARLAAAGGGGVWRRGVGCGGEGGSDGSVLAIARSGARCERGGGWRRGCSGGGRRRGCRRGRRGCRHGSGGGGAWRSVEARPAVWRTARPVEMRPAAWHGGRLGGVESGTARGAWRQAQQRGDAAGSGRPVWHVEERPAAWRLPTTRGCAAGGAGAATEAVARPLSARWQPPAAPTGVLAAVQRGCGRLWRRWLAELRGPVPWPPWPVLVSAAEECG
uniref:DUF834 domain-containing protein n=1 Tax=Oryza meridionalis TaxID=40149 RepID=A0A0E0F959_9ORYZ